MEHREITAIVKPKIIQKGVSKRNTCPKKGAVRRGNEEKERGNLLIKIMKKKKDRRGGIEGSRNEMNGTMERCCARKKD